MERLKINFKKSFTFLAISSLHLLKVGYACFGICILTKRYVYPRLLLITKGQVYLRLSDLQNAKFYVLVLTFMFTNCLTRQTLSLHGLSNLQKCQVYFRLFDSPELKFKFPKAEFAFIRSVYQTLRLRGWFVRLTQISSLR